MGILKCALTVDDSPTLRKMVVFALKKKLGCKDVYEAGDGLEAIEILTIHPKEIELIICDINMPNMNGLEFLSRIKKKESFSHIPVIMLTTESRYEEREKAIKLGADAYLNKPFNLEVFAQTARKVVEEKYGRR